MKSIDALSRLRIKINNAPVTILTTVVLPYFFLLFLQMNKAQPGKKTSRFKAARQKQQ